MVSIYFISLVAYGMNPVYIVVGTFIFPVWHLRLGRNVALMAAFLLSVTTLMRNWWWTMDWMNCCHLWEKLSSNSAKFLQKSSTYNNLVAMAATVECNYNQTVGFSRHGPGPQSVFMNGRVHHYMRIASSTSQRNYCTVIFLQYIIFYCTIVVFTFYWHNYCTDFFFQWDILLYIIS